MSEYNCRPIKNCFHCNCTDISLNLDQNKKVGKIQCNECRFGISISFVYYSETSEMIDQLIFDWNLEQPKREHYFGLGANQ